MSRVLAGIGYARAETRSKVLTAVKELGYSPNLVARSLRARRTKVIGLVVADIENPFFSTLSRAVQDAAYAHGLNVILCNTGENPEREQSYLQVLKAENAAGLIIAPTHQSNESFSHIRRLGIPTVVIDRSVGEYDLDNVVINNTEAAHELTTHLIARGKSRIAGVFGYGSTTGRERHKGVRSALSAAGLVTESRQFQFVPAREDAGYDAAHSFIRLQPQPDAIIASNALLAAGVYRALMERGIDVPGRIAFAAFDDTLWSPMVRPSVTVIRQPTAALGATALELLLSRIADPERACRTIVLPAELVVRDSS